MLLIVVKEMKYENMLRMTKYLCSKDYYLKDSEDLRITFEHLEFIEPAGALLFLTTMDKIRGLKVPYGIEPINHLKRSAISYGETMGIFQQLGISDAPSYTSGATYIAPTKIKIQEVFRKLDDVGESIESYYETISDKIVGKALRLVDSEVDEGVRDLFIFVVREMIRNIFDHSQSPHYYYASQAYRANNSVEVVIADVGVGLLATIPFDVEERWFGKDTDEEAIRKALTPGISALSNHSYAPEDYKNSGYGLALVKRIIQRTDGLFSIASGTKSITFTAEEEIINNCDINGTIVRMRLQLDKLESVSFQEILDEAENEAKIKGFKQIPSTASKTIKSKKI